MDAVPSGMAAVVNRGRRRVRWLVVASVVRLKCGARGPSVGGVVTLLHRRISHEREGDLHAKRAPDAGFAADVDLAAVLTDDELRQREADAAVRAVRGLVVRGAASGGGAGRVAPIVERGELDAAGAVASSAPGAASADAPDDDDDGGERRVRPERERHPGG